MANVYLDRNLLSYNGTAVSVFNGTAYSFGNNAFAGNQSDGGPFLSIGLQ